MNQRKAGKRGENPEAWGKEKWGQDGSVALAVRSAIFLHPFGLGQASDPPCDLSLSAMALAGAAAYGLPAGRWCRRPLATFLVNCRSGDEYRSVAENGRKRRQPGKGEQPGKSRRKTGQTPARDRSGRLGPLTFWPLLV